MILGPDARPVEDDPVVALEHRCPVGRPASSSSSVGRPPSQRLVHHLILCLLKVRTDGRALRSATSSGRPRSTAGARVTGSSRQRRLRPRRSASTRSRPSARPSRVGQAEVVLPRRAPCGRPTTPRLPHRGRRRLPPDLRSARPAARSGLITSVVKPCATFGAISGWSNGASAE